MLGGSSAEFRRVSQSEAEALVNAPYNTPTFSDSDAKERFYEEYKHADAVVRLNLQHLGDVDAFGEKEFSTGNPWNSSRKIGVTLNAKRLFHKETVASLQAAVEEIPVDYLIVLSGEYVVGKGTFYICVQKGGNVLGYAPKNEMLDPFGFM